MGRINANPDFSESVTRFQKFLGESGYPPRVIWVDPQDVLLTGTCQALVRVSVPADKELHAQAVFEKGMKEQMGVLFATLCEMDDVSCCYAWVPVDEEEAHRHLMPRDLKLSANIGESRLFGKAVTNHFRWLWLRLRHRKHQELRDQLFLRYSKKAP
jgi:hypothetical protein